MVGTEGCRCEVSWGINFHGCRQKNGWTEEDMGSLWPPDFSHLVSWFSAAEIKIPGRSKKRENGLLGSSFQGRSIIVGRSGWQELEAAWSHHEPTVKSREQGVKAHIPVFSSDTIQNPLAREWCLPRWDLNRAPHRHPHGLTQFRQSLTGILSMCLCVNS